MDEIKYIIRTPKEDNFTRVDNILVNDKNLSLKAKGIMLYILSKPDDWKVYIKEITKNNKDGIDSVRSGINELLLLKYIQREKRRGEDGTYAWEYIISENPYNTTNQSTLDYPDMDYPGMENPTILTTDSTKTNSTNISKDIGNISLKEKNNNHGNKELLILKDVLIRKYPVEIVGITNTRELQNLKQVCSPRKGRDEWMSPYWRDNFEKFLKEYLSTTDQKYLVRSVKKLKDRVKDWRERGGVSKELDEVKRPKL